MSWAELETIGINFEKALRLSGKCGIEVRDCVFWLKGEKMPHAVQLVDDWMLRYLWGEGSNLRKERMVTVLIRERPGRRGQT